VGLTWYQSSSPEATAVVEFPYVVICIGIGELWLALRAGLLLWGGLSSSSRQHHYAAGHGLSYDRGKCLIC
jgi:hypothetical protein